MYCLDFNINAIGINFTYLLLTPRGGWKEVIKSHVQALIS